MFNGEFFFRVWALFRKPDFYLITFAGNALVMCAAFFLYYLEKGRNPGINTLLDSFWWAVATVTTVGYGDIIPVTTEGKLLGIALMLLGTGLFATYTALFAGALLSSDYKVMSRQAKKILQEEKDLKDISESLREILEHIETRKNK